jgi:hypothetical protein
MTTDEIAPGISWFRSSVRRAGSLITVIYCIARIRKVIWLRAREAGSLRLSRDTHRSVIPPIIVDR